MEPIGAIDRSQLPSDIRTASREAQSKYAAAQQFEQMLVKRMLAEVVDSSQESGADTEDELGGSSVDAVTAHYREMLPELMAKAVSGAGGLGIARDLYDSMKDRT